MIVCHLVFLMLSVRCCVFIHGHDDSDGSVSSPQPFVRTATVLSVNSCITTPRVTLHHLIHITTLHRDSPWQKALRRLAVTSESPHASYLTRVADSGFIFCTTQKKKNRPPGPLTSPNTSGLDLKESLLNVSRTLERYTYRTRSASETKQKNRACNAYKTNTQIVCSKLSKKRFFIFDAMRRSVVFFFVSAKSWHGK